MPGGASLSDGCTPDIGVEITQGQWQEYLHITGHLFSEEGTWQVCVALDTCNYARRNGIGRKIVNAIRLFVRSKNLYQKRIRRE